MERIIISIIVPVYNVEKYLRQCLDSITAQTFTDWECILVDDGSKDNSGSICDEFAAKDSRIKVIHKENGGVATARNTALEAVTGEFVTFLDSDDNIPHNTLQLYIENFAKSKDIDIVIGGFKKIYTATKKVDFYHNSISSIEYNQAEIFRRLNDNCCWNECLKASLIGSLRFNNNLKWNEDHLFNYDCITRARAICYIPDNVYNYYVRDAESLSNVKNPFVVILTCAQICEYRLKMVKGAQDDSLLNNIHNSYINMFHYALKLLNTKEYKARIAEFRRKLPLVEILQNDLSAKAFISSHLGSYVAMKTYIVIRKLMLIHKLLRG